MTAGLLFVLCNLLLFQAQPLLAAASILPGMKVNILYPSQAVRYKTGKQLITTSLSTLFIVISS